MTKDEILKRIAEGKDSIEVVRNLAREALAQPEQEPVAYFNPQVKGGFYWAKPTKITAPVTVNVEPMPLYTTPPQRTWVGLTDEEITEWRKRYKFSRALLSEVEAKLKDKNI